MDELYKILQLQIIAECQKSVEKTVRDKTESLFIKKESLALSDSAMWKQVERMFHSPEAISF